MSCCVYTVFTKALHLCTSIKSSVHCVNVRCSCLFRSHHRQSKTILLDYFLLHHLALSWGGCYNYCFINHYFWLAEKGFLGYFINLHKKCTCSTSCTCIADRYVYIVCIFTFSCTQYMSYTFCVIFNDENQSRFSCTCSDELQHNTVHLLEYKHSFCKGVTDCCAHFCSIVSSQLTSFVAVMYTDTPVALCPRLKPTTIQRLLGNCTIPLYTTQWNSVANDLDMKEFWI